MNLTIGLTVVMLAVGIGILLAANKTKQNGLYYICMFWSAVSALITWFGRVYAPNFNIDSLYALFIFAFFQLFIGAADVVVLLIAFFSRSKDES